MRQRTSIASFLILASFVSHFVPTNSVDDLKHSWQWSWKCKAGKCVKSDSPSYVTDLSAGSTQAICKLTCGKYGSLWPQPTGETKIGQKAIAFHPSRVKVEITEAGTRASREFLQRVGKLWQGQLYAECGSDCSLIPQTQVNVYIAAATSDLKLDWNTDETYTLDVSTEGNDVTVKIRAHTVYGARHGLETLGQLITGFTTARNGASGTRSGQRVLVMVTQARVVDAPAFAHRGLLLDTARNYLPLSAILRTIDGMAQVKLNVFHWHATDTQSFPLHVPRVPHLAIYGAYSSEKVYTHSDITYIIEYAKLRGVRVLIEIDAPAHSGNGWQWGEENGLGKLAVCVNELPWRSYCIQPPCGQLNPANPNVYAVLRDLYQDLIELLPPGEVFHMGGDEVFFACWNNSQEILDYLQNKGHGRTEGDFLQLWADFQATALQVFDEVNPQTKVPIVLWSSHLTQPDVIESFLDKSRYVIETWVEANQTLPDQLLSMGYRLILATKDTWYLDHGFWGTTKYHSWRVAYDNKIPKKTGVLGGEAAMWAELVDENSLDAKVWPRAAAIAERLWSNPTTSSLSAEPRLQQLRPRLIRIGLSPDAISPEYCTQNEALCF